MLYFVAIRKGMITFVATCDWDPNSERVQSLKEKSAILTKSMNLLGRETETAIWL